VACQEIIGEIQDEPERTPNSSSPEFGAYTARTECPTFERFLYRKRATWCQMMVDAIDFVRQHGVVLESAKGPIPNLAEAVANSPIRGNWWSHADGKKIFRATRLVRESKHVLVCRLVEGKVTYVHRRLWPAIVRLAQYFGNQALVAIHEEHSASGEHRIKELPFPKWVPLNTRNKARTLSEGEAARQLGPWAEALVDRYSSGDSSKKR
jgi:hypothetical protein